MLKKIAITAALLVILQIGVHIAFLFSTSYEMSLSYLKENIQVKETVGEIDKIGLVPLGQKVKVQGGDGTARYEIDILGAKGKCRAFVLAVKAGDKWRIEKAHLLLPDSSVVILKQ